MRRLAARSAALDLAGVCEIVYTRLVYVVFLVQIRLLSTIPLLGLEKGLTLLLSALIHAYDAFEPAWVSQGLGVSQRFTIIETHWLFFLGYGGVLATLSIFLRFWDFFVVRAVLYPLYIANAPYATFDKLRCRPLPAFQARAKPPPFAAPLAMPPSDFASV